MRVPCYETLVLIVHDYGSKTKVKPYGSFVGVPTLFAGAPSKPITTNLM